MGKPLADKRRNLNFRQVMQIGVLLEKNGTRDEEKGLYTYAAGWSDGRVRDEVDPTLPIERVIDLREKNFGLIVLADRTVLGRRQFMTRIADMEAKMKNLEQRFQALERDLGVGADSGKWKPNSDAEHGKSDLLAPLRDKFKVS